MVQPGRAGAGALERLFSMIALVGAAVVGGCQSGAAAPFWGSAAGGNDCYRLSPIGLSGAPADIDRACRAAAASASIRAPQLAVAQYYIGRADRELAQQEPAGSVGRSTRLEDAKRFLDSALVVNQGSNADLDNAATLELARVYRLQRNFERALALTDQYLRASSRAQLANVEARTERADIFLDRGADGDTDQALRELDAAFAQPNLNTENAVLVQRGRERLIEIATRLGNAAMDAPQQNRDTVQRAIDMFAYAQRAADGPMGRLQNVDVPGIYVNLGRAELRMAGLLGRARDIEFGCEAGEALESRLSQAREYFTRALDLGDTAPARWGRGCALQALGAPNEALADFTQATTLAPNDGANYLALARAQGASGIDPTASYARALELAGPSAAQRGRIYVEMADVHLRRLAVLRREEGADSARKNAEVAAAFKYLNQALDAMPTYGPALIRRGQLYMEERPNQFQLAGADLNAAVRQLRRTDDASLRGEVYYYLSLYEEKRAMSDRRLAAQAITYADQALAAHEDVRYSAHACLVRVRFGRVSAANEAANPCKAGSDHDPADLLNEGMYELRRARLAYLRSDIRTDAWEAAYTAFSDGLERLPLGADTTQQTRALRARLEVGKGIALYCVGLEKLGREAINGATQREESYFKEFGVAECNPLR